MSEISKKHIIDEIIRTANEKNGVPLGQMSFQKITGIKAYDWKGKFWANWGDALEEAGLKRNTFTKAYDKKTLIEHVICLIRELKKIPTTTEFCLKHNQFKDFPTYNAFRNGLGRKREMVEIIKNYCKDKSGYEDVIEICEKVLIASEKQEIKKDTEETKPRFSFVYLMKSGQYYKIGKSDCVEKRNYEIGIKLPEELKIIHKIKTDDPSGIEAYWHKRFENKRKGGEWFDLSNSDVKAFKRRTFM